MRRNLLILLLLVFFALLTQAQVDSLRFAKTDSVTAAIDHKTDSLSKKLRNLQNPKLKIPFSNKADSLKEGIDAKLHKPDELAAKLKHKADSINQQHQIEQYNKKVTVLQKHLSNHIDSLSHLKVKPPQFTQSIDSLRGKLDSLKNAGPVKDVKRAEQQLAQLRTKLNSKVKGLQSKMSKDFGEIGKLGGNVPNVNLPNVKLPNVNANLPNVNLPNLNTQLPGTSTNLNLNTSVPGTNLPSIGAAAGTVGGAASGLVVGAMEGHTGNKLGDDVWMGAVSGFVGGAVGGALEKPIESLKVGKVLESSLKGGVTGLTGGYTHGLVLGLSKGYNFADASKLGVSEGIIGLGIGLGGGAIEGALKSDNLFERLMPKVNERWGSKGVGHASQTLGVPKSSILYKGFMKSGIAGKIGSGFLEGSSDGVVGEDTGAFKNFNHFLWGSLFDDLDP